MSVKS